MRRIALSLLALAAAAVPVLVNAPATGAVDTPTFVSYPAPADAATSAAEPTLGVNLKTGAVMYIAGLQTYRVGDWDKSGVGTSTWTDVSYILTSEYTADPILETDTTTGRTFVNQLTYSNPGSVMAYTDDDGATWTPVPYGSGFGPNLDHQTVGFSKWRAESPFKPVNGYPNAIYYCTNDIVASDCAVSLDGGDTFTPSRPAYTEEDCSPLHGHLKSAPDGTAYLPPDGCVGDSTDPAGVVVTEDNGFTWDVRLVPGTDSGDAGHPSLGIANDGTVYLAYGSKSGETNHGPVRVARSRDKGLTWTAPVALGTDLGVKATSFPVAVAGDSDRAAVAYLGTTDPGDPRSQASFNGRWDLYVSMTYDGGATWQTVNATPDSPVQVGSICANGLTCGSDRNLLDFNDMVIDEKGRVLVGLSDGCLKATCTTADRNEHGLIVRQASGKGLLAAFDAPSTVFRPEPTGGTGTPLPVPTRAAPVRTQPRQPLASTGVDLALPAAAAAFAAVAVLAARRRRASARHL